MIELSSLGNWKFNDDSSNWTLVAAGDCCPNGRLEPVFISGKPDQILDRPILELFSRATYTIANLETPLCVSRTPIRKTGPNFRVVPETALGLKNAGIDLVALANNHIMDQGKQGLEETIRSLDQYNISYHGAGITHEQACKPLGVEIGGQKVVFLNFAEGEFARCQENGPGAARLDPVENIALIQKVTKENDIVIVSVHAGNEFQFFPSPYLQKIYRKMVDAGAHLILGHHPHVPQGIEEYNGSLIVYSLGNFLFDSNHGSFFHKLKKVMYNRKINYGEDISFLLKVQFGSSRISSFSAHPFKKDKNARIMLLGGKEKLRFISYLNEVSAPLSDQKRLRLLWEQQVIELFDMYNRQLGQWFVRSFFKSRRQNSQIARVLFNVIKTDAHREVLMTAFQLFSEERFYRNKESQAYVDNLRKLLMGL